MAPSIVAAGGLDELGTVEHQIITRSPDPIPRRWRAGEPADPAVQLSPGDGAAEVAQAVARGCMRLWRASWVIQFWRRDR